MRTKLLRSLAASFALLASVPAAAVAATTPAPPAASWAAVTSPPFNSTGRVFVRLDSYGPLSTVQITNSSGADICIHQVVVEFTDRTTLIRRGQAVAQRDGKPLTLALGATPREVLRIVVYGEVGAQLTLAVR